MVGGRRRGCNQVWQELRSLGTTTAGATHVHVCWTRRLQCSPCQKKTAGNAPAMHQPTAKLETRKTREMVTMASSLRTAKGVRPTMAS